MQTQVPYNLVGTCLESQTSVLGPVEIPLVNYCDDQLIQDLKQYWKNHFLQGLPKASFEDFMLVINKLSSKLGCRACTYKLSHSQSKIYVEWAIHHSLKHRDQAYRKMFGATFEQFINDSSESAENVKRRISNAFVSRQMTGHGNWEMMDIAASSEQKLVLFDMQSMSRCMSCPFREEEHLVSLFERIEQFSNIYIN